MQGEKRSKVGHLASILDAADVDFLTKNTAVVLIVDRP